MARTEEGLAQKEKEEADHKQKVQGVMQGLREISVSVALAQLEPIAKPEIIKIVSSQTQKNDTEDLRKLITDLVDDMERQINKSSSSNMDMAIMEQSVKTLSAIISLFFALK
ncbi:hypothetical protein ACFLTT_03720 [Chloroflexota bacterium]